MSDTNSGANSDNSGNGGAGADKSDSDNDSNKNKDGDNEELVPKSTAERYKKDLLKWKDRAADTSKKLDEALERLSALETNGEDGKAKADRLAKEVDTWKSKYEKANEGFVYSEKYRAVFGELKKLGLRDDAEDILEYEDLADIEVETTSKGRVEVHGAKDWASSFFNKRKYLFDPKKTVKVNSADGRNTGGSSDSEKITPSMVVEAEKLAKKTGKPEHKADYQKKLDLYHKQRSAK